MLNPARIKEGVLIAALAGFVAVGATWIIAIPVIQADQAGLRKDMERMEQRIDRRMERMEERMMVPAWERDRAMRSAPQSLTSPGDPKPQPESAGAPMPMIENRLGAFGRREP